MMLHKFKENRHGPVPRRKWGYCMLLVPLLGFPFKQAKAQAPVIVSHTVNFHEPDLHLDPFIAPDGLTYTKLSYTGLGNTIDTPGSPSLPVKYVKLIVPSDKDYSDIVVDITVPKPIGVSHLLFPVQHPVPTAEDTPPPPFVGPDAAYYTSGTYPAPIVRYIGEGYFDGNKHIVTVAVYPVQYQPATTKLQFYSSVTFHVKERSGSTPHMQSINKSHSAASAMYAKALQGLVANPGDISRFAWTGGPGLKPTGWSVPFYEYVIITSQDLVPAFEELVGWKRRKGLNAGIVDIQDILADPMAAGGDLVSGINDDAGRLRAYLQAGYQSGTVYAVLGGDRTIIPLRYAAGYTNTFNGGDGMIPSDLYYTDFNGDWDMDSDIYYGESFGNDAVDYQPEIFVGRMLVNTEMQVTNHVHKVIRYERDPGRGDHAYLSRAFMTQADELLSGSEADEVAAQFTFFPAGNINIWNETPTSYDPAPTGPSAVNVLSEITKHYGLVSLFGHGGPYNVVVAAGGNNDCPKERFTSLDGIDGFCAAVVTGNGLDNLDDFNHVDHPYQDYPHLYYTIACETSPFDDWLKPAPAFEDMGEVYTRKFKAGAMAFMANTRYGWVTTSSQMYEIFAKKISEGNYKIGVAEGLSKADFFNGWGWCEKTHHLVGCPETEMWTAEPSHFSDVKVSSAGSSVTVTTGGINATICVTSSLDNGQTYQQTVENVTSYTFTGVPASFAVCVNRHDFIPFLWKQDVTVQSHTFTGTAYVAADNINSGEAVDPSSPTGITKVSSGANVFFHGATNVVLDKGFEVEAGAAFEAK